VITLEIVGEVLGHDGDEVIWSYFKRHWAAWVPGLGERCGRRTEKAAHHAKNSSQTHVFIKPESLNPPFSDRRHLRFRGRQTGRQRGHEPEPVTLPAQRFPHPGITKERHRQPVAFG